MERSSTMVASRWAKVVAGEGDAQARAGRLVHLAIDERYFGTLFKNGQPVGAFLRVALFVELHLEDPRFDHFIVKIVAFTGAFAHAGKHRYTTVKLGDIVD